MALDIPMLCLGLLTRGEASGYELKKALQDGPIGQFMEASYGSIYPALSRLTHQGFATCRESAGERGHTKKVYAVTAAGRAAFAERLRTVPAEDKLRLEFLYFLMFSDLLGADHTALVIDHKLATQKAKLAMMRNGTSGIDPPGERFVRGYAEAMLSTSIEYLEAHRSLIETAPNQSAASQTVQADGVQAGTVQARTVQTDSVHPDTGKKAALA